jgi:hypothetical protein
LVNRPSTAKDNSLLVVDSCFNLFSIVLRFRMQI